MDSQTWIVISGFLIVLFIQNISQQYPDSVANYPEVCQNLHDVGFKLIPYIGMNWNDIADIWIVVSLVIAAILFFTFDRTQLIFRRFFITYSSIFLLRAITVFVTVYPRLPYETSANFHAPGGSFLWGSLLILSGVRTTAKDMMFSGHTAGFILSASYVGRYSSNIFLKVIYWVFNILGTISLIAAREHYSADIVVAIIVTRFVFANYHLWLDSEYPRFWNPGIMIETQRPIQIVYPMHLQDSTQRRFNVEPNLVVTRTTTGKKSIILNTWQYTSWARYRWYRFWKWLDNE